jgi:hypothetical protein
MLHSIEPRSLPATIGDAIVITPKLGFRYLWDDSLCIVQPERKGDSHDQQDWEEELLNMCRYYKHAAAILIIESAAGDEEGFLADLSKNPNFKSTQTPIIVPVQIDGITGHIEIERAYYPDGESLHHVVYPASEISDFPRFIKPVPGKITPHEQRAWTLQ